MEVISDIKLNYENFNPTQLDAIKQLIQQNATSNPDWVKTFYIVLTSKNKIPISGFGQKPLTVILNSHVKVPYVVNSCFHRMEINTESLNEYIGSTDKSTNALYIAFSYGVLSSIANTFDVA